MTAGLQIIRSILPCSCIALQVLVCRTRSLDTQDFKMAKSVILSVVLLSFLNLSASTHVEFMNCGKLAGLYFLAIFLPRSLPLYDHVTIMKSPVTSAHEIEGIAAVCCCLRVSSDCFFSSLIKICFVWKPSEFMVRSMKIMSVCVGTCLDLYCTIYSVIEISYFARLIVVIVKN